MPENSERRPPRRARGKTKRYTEAQLDRFEREIADHPPEIVESSQDRWSQIRDGFENLLDAPPTDDES